MNSSDKPVNRNTGSIIAKCLIVFVVLGIVCSLSIWAWFTSVQEATAKGISVTAKANGVEVSWDNKDFYYNLTALDDNAMKADSTGKTGKAKFLNEDGSAFGLKLITGDGINFFEPYLNRRTGEHIMDGDRWAGVEINKNNSQGRYIDVELFFRSTLQRDVYLAKNSSVTPKNPTGNLSEYGNFSKDYISAASRVAFLDEEENLSFIWAPNADDLLTESEDGFIKYTTTQKDNGGASSGTLPEDLLTDKNGNNQYYLWLPKDYITDEVTIHSDFTPIGMTFQSFLGTKGLYVAEFVINTPSRNNPTIPFFINQSSTTTNFSTDKNNINCYDSFLTNIEADEKTPKVAISRNTYNVNNDATTAFYLSEFNTLNTTIKIGYNPVTKVTVILSYSADVENGSFDRTGVSSEEIIYHPLNGGEKCTLVNPESSVAFSTSEHFVKSIHFKKDSNKLNVLPVSVTLNELFTAEKDESDGTGYKATYKFANINPNTNTTKYLSVNGGTVSLNDTGSDFKLEYIEEDFGPVLVSEDGYCLVCVNNTMKAVKFDESLDKSTVVTVYTGISYELKHDQASEKYQYYSVDHGIVELTTNSSTSDIKLYTTNAGETSSDSIGPAIITLTKAKDTDPYYTGKIIMRIWVEGEDREAKTPLADGIFDLSIHFTSK